MIRPTDQPYYHEGFYWHSRCSGYESHYINTAASHVSKVAQHVPERRRVAIQAGGHCGLWATQLANLFENVYTFEPDMDNFRCLVLNANSWNVYPFRSFLGCQHEQRLFLMGAESGRGQAGLSILHTVQLDGEPMALTTGVVWGTPTLMIDDLKLNHCDLICLDVEGYETPALIGACQTIEKHSPIILTERTGKMSADGQDYSHETTANLLKAWRYRQVDQIDKDVIWARQ